MSKWQTGNTDMTNLLQLTINLQKSHQTQRTLQPMCKGRMLFIWVDIHISSRGQQHPKCEPAIRLVYPPLFCKLHSSSNPTNKNLQRYTRRFKQLYFSNHSELDKFIWTLLLTMTKTVASKNIDISPQITLYNWFHAVAAFCVFIYY